MIVRLLRMSYPCSLTAKGMQKKPAPIRTSLFQSDKGGGWPSATATRPGAYRPAGHPAIIRRQLGIEGVQQLVIVVERSSRGGAGPHEAICISRRPDAGRAIGGRNGAVVRVEAVVGAVTGHCLDAVHGGIEIKPDAAVASSSRLDGPAAVATPVSELRA